MPGWRNGLRRGLKILDPKGFVGPNPTPGTKIFLEKLTLFRYTAWAGNGGVAEWFKAASC